MSMMLMVKAMRIKVGNPLRKLVLIKLADNANDLGECWPSHQHIADQCEISRRSVINHINALEEMGFLRKEYRAKNNEKQSNLYYLTLSEKAQVKEADKGGAGDSLPSAGDSLGGGAGDAHRTSHSSEPIIEPIKEPKAPTAFDELIARGVDEQVAKDFLHIRKAKKAPLTFTAIQGIEREALKANLEFSEVVRICAERGWQGFNANWSLGGSSTAVNDFNTQDYGSAVIPAKFRK
ncbi:helix-turn-helix domain-containing protein [Ignatzschineria larvae DSM 13226]|uniref:Helix-turn-helix domain-containing protein n=1 Tax=Ignatzschineria larvae DSM 13226 TaxID=1111732 RepID=A0ABZ3BZ76_9GAMM|nr:helix-turn-helix domain-containing protein [Ignatzschineria larvae]